MPPDTKKRNIAVVAVGLLLLLGVPLSRMWYGGRGNRARERLEREKAEAIAAITPLAKKDLACEDVKVTSANALWAVGCGKRARYVRGPNGFVREGDVEPAGEEGDLCAIRWSATLPRPAEAGAPESARAAAAAIAQNRTARIRFPIEKFPVTGLAKLRYGEHVEVFLEPGVALGDEVVVPCIDPNADGGVRAADRCTQPWSAVVEVADCD